MPQPVTFERPDNGHTGTTPADGQGWIERAQDTAEGIPASATGRVGEKAASRARDLRRSAARCYGVRPLNLVVPQPTPLKVRLKLATFVDPERQRQEHIRSTIRDLLTIDAPGSYRRTVNSHINVRMMQEHYKDQAQVDDARVVIQAYKRLNERIVARHFSGSPLAVLLVPTTILIAGILANAPLGDKTFQILACLACFTVVAGSWMLINIGWRHGYQQCLWHVAEVAPADARAASEMARQERKSRVAFKRQLSTRRMGFKLRRPPRGEGYLYVVGFDTGTVKVGQTEDPKARLATHRSEAAAFGAHITNYWISPSHSNFKGNETRLINQCVNVSRRSRKEYFHEVGYRRAVEFASALTYFSADAEQTSTEGVWA